MIKNAMKTCNQEAFRVGELQTGKSRPQTTAFTLVELLVVIAIIAILAAILLPALSKAKAKSQDLACRNNLKQLQLCWNLYVDDFQGLLPPITTLMTSANSWMSPAPSWAVGDAITDLTASNLQTGVLFPYNRSLGVYHCPADKSTVDQNPSVPRTRSYQLDEGLNGTYPQHAPLPPGWKKLKFSDLLHPSPTDVLTFIDSDPVTGDSADFTQEFQEFTGHPDAWGCLPGERHNVGASLAFADGHAEHWRWRWSRSASAEVATYAIANAADQADFQRVKNAFPKP